MNRSHTNNWWISKFNSLANKEGLRISSQIIIADCTLRDGEQQAGIVFRKEDKVKIARKLDEINIHEIEVGMPAVSKEDEEAVKAIVRENLNAKIHCLARATKNDIEKIIDCGVTRVQISLPSGEPQIRYKLKWSEERVIETALEITDFAKDHGMWVNLSPYDTTRANLDFLKRYLRAVKDNIDRVRLVDTVGSATPAAIKYLVYEMKGIIGDKPLEIHCHNDFGLATVNTLAGLEAGAEVASTTINGIGERVGNAATEEVAIALLVLYGLDIGIKYNQLMETSKLVQSLSGIEVSPNKPIVGEGAFCHESGLTVAGVLEMPFTGEPYLPELVGQKRKIVIGKGSGFSSIAFKLKNLGINASEKQIRDILEKVKELSIEKKKALTDLDLKSIVEEIFSRNSNRNKK